jgi:hypothetical protein
MSERFLARHRTDGAPRGVGLLRRRGWSPRIGWHHGPSRGSFSVRKARRLGVVFGSATICFGPEVRILEARRLSATPIVIGWSRPR